MLQPHLIPEKTSSTDALIRRLAFGVLAQREHSQRELIEKIARKLKKRTELSITETQIAEVVAVISTDGLQSDTRYIEMLIRSRIHQGHGPIRIAQELKQKGIQAPDYESLLDSRGEEWLERARQAKQKKFGNGKVLDQKVLDAREKGRQLRFLQYRGFTTEQIRYALT